MLGMRSMTMPEPPVPPPLCESPVVLGVPAPPPPPPVLAVPFVPAESFPPAPPPPLLLHYLLAQPGHNLIRVMYGKLIGKLLVLTKHK